MASAQVFEDFESGNYSNWLQNPSQRWMADTILPVSGNYSLHHIFDNSQNGTDVAALAFRGFHPDEGDARWSFQVKHGYDPSSSNNWAVLLMYDSVPADVPGINQIRGFAAGVNITGSDDSLRLVKIRDGIVTVITGCGLNWQTMIGEDNFGNVTVERSATGNWHISVSDVSGSCLCSGNGYDSELTGSDYFGIMYRYTATKDRLLWVDNITVDGTFYEDTIPPGVISCTPEGKNSVTVSFSEDPEETGMIPENFYLNDEDNIPESVNKISSQDYSLVFSGMKNKLENKLVIQKICDIPGNCSEKVSYEFTPVWAEAGDVIINEIMPDPSPAVSLPEAEYIEIFNRSTFEFDLTGWYILAGDTRSSFPAVKLCGGCVMILCDEDDTTAFSRYGKVAGFRNLPSLDDGGEIICLMDETGQLVHGVEYSPQWYGDGLKEGGGWSLEMNNAGYPFSTDGNWGSSISWEGGTPGVANSAFPGHTDHHFSGIENVFAGDSLSVFVRFSEPVADLETHVQDIRIDGNRVKLVCPGDILFRRFVLIPESELEHGKEYMLEISPEVVDFAGNNMDRSRYVFGLAEKAERGDILFNEVLFNPLPGDADYIEFYNASAKILDASRLQIVSVSGDGQDTSGLYRLSAESRCILPGTYYAITEDKERTEDRYYTSAGEYISETDLPSMPDDRGHLVLFNRELEKIDEVIFSEKMHYPLLSGQEGISLEKAAPLLSSFDSGNWHSAAGSSGWGTPGAPNSVFSVNPVQKEGVTLSSARVSPDNDGFEDILEIQISLNGTNNVLSLSVYDESGNLVKTLASNLLSGPQAMIGWDGTCSDGNIARTGIYIIHTSMFDENGRYKQWKKVCSVIR